jgi:hypothetical protein
VLDDEYCTLIILCYFTNKPRSCHTLSNIEIWRNFIEEIEITVACERRCESDPLEFATRECLNRLINNRIQAQLLDIP